MSNRITLALGALVALVGASACSGADAAERSSPATERRPEVHAPVAFSESLRFEVAPEGNTARYRVREQLVGFDLPNDAVGTTSRISGRVVIDDGGSLVPGASSIVVEIGDLQSDQARRDNFIRNRLLEAEQYPTVELRPTAVRGLSGALPTSGSRDFELLGDLTVKGVTRPTTWQVSARFDGGRLTGSASTRFTFADFELTQPRVPVVLSVADTIRLEYDFNLIAQRVGGD